MAAALQRHVATKTPKAKLFNLPHLSNMARMIRADLAAARKAWIAEATTDPEEYTRREQSDFLAAENHAGESLDFHSLRHTCGAWLAQSGAHLKTVQSVMRHSTITLTMDTYGHLFPGAEAEAAGRLGAMLHGRQEVDQRLKATGTDCDAPNRETGAQRLGAAVGTRYGADVMQRHAIYHDRPAQILNRVSLVKSAPYMPECR